jgi:hypothetical protein
MSATDHQEHATSSSLTDLDQLYSQLKQLTPTTETLDLFLETAISYLHCLYRCYQNNAPQNLEKVKPFFEQVLLAINGGIFQDTGPHAYAAIRQGELRDYLPEQYNPRLVLDQLHMLLHEFTSGSELQDTTLSWMLRNTLGSITRAEGSSWLPRASILKRLPDQFLPIVDTWHAQIGLHQERAAVYHTMLAYRCMPQIRVLFEEQLTELKRKYDEQINTLEQEVKRLETASTKEQTRSQQEFSIAQDALFKAADSLKVQLQECIQALNRNSPADKQLGQEATLQEATKHALELMTESLRAEQAARTERAQLISGIQTLLQQRTPSVKLNEQSSNTDILATLQSHLSSTQDVTSEDESPQTALDSAPPSLTPLQQHSASSRPHQRLPANGLSQPDLKRLMQHFK